jgi:hypothetical protein
MSFGIATLLELITKAVKTSSTTNTDKACGKQKSNQLYLQLGSLLDCYSSESSPLAFVRAMVLVHLDGQLIPAGFGVHYRWGSINRE